MGNLRIVAFAGSLRKESYNKKILEIIAEKVAGYDVEIKILDLNDYEIPLFNQDIEDEGMPLKTKEFKKEIHNANAILIASPEYNGSFSGVLKNVIDWVSRKLNPNESMYEAFAKKPVGLVAASPGGLGGIRGIIQLRGVMFDLKAAVMPEYASISEAYNIDETKIAKLEAFGGNYIEFCKKLI
ncbi:NADPH-dependent FMN reductase [Candidatus Jidaibacter acanthamoebae]|nr:NAD(P)H-dependent oxidoreductase [Candidatus Jidaibacter acanthamoeba]